MVDVLEGRILVGATENLLIFVIVRVKRRGVDCKWIVARISRIKCRIVSTSDARWETWAARGGSREPRAKLGSGSPLPCLERSVRRNFYFAEVSQSTRQCSSLSYRHSRLTFDWTHSTIGNSREIKTYRRVADIYKRYKCKGFRRYKMLAQQ